MGRKIVSEKRESATKAGSLVSYYVVRKFGSELKIFYKTQERISGKIAFDRIYFTLAIGDNPREERDENRSIR